MLINWQDIAYKTLWTALAAALGVLGTYALDAPTAIAPIAIAVINAGTAWVRQKLGTTPPTAPPAEGLRVPPR